MNRALLGPGKRNSRNVFRRSRKAAKKSRLRLSIEAITSGTCGIYLLIFLNTLSESYDWSIILFKAWDDLINGLNSLVNVLISLVTISLVLFLVILGLTLLIGSCSRLFRVLTASDVSHRVHKD